MKIKWSSRKVIFGLLLIAVGVSLELLSPRGLTEVAAAFLAAIGATYFAGNVGEHYMEAKKAPAASASSTVQVDNSALEAQLMAIVAAGDEAKKQYLQYLDGILKTQNYIIKAAGLEKKAS